MRILVINWQDWTHPRAGGAEFHLREVFSRIAARGHGVDLLCVAHGQRPPEEHLDGINIVRRGGSYWLFNYIVPGVYRRILRRNRYHVIVDDLNKVPFYTPLFSDRPVVALVHHLFGSTVFREANPLSGSYVYATELAIPWVYRHSRFIAVSPSTADDLVSRGIARERIGVIPNGLPEIDFDSVLERPKSTDPLFVYLGRLKRYKQIELMFEALAQLRARYPRARLVIAGEGDYRPALEARRAALGLEQAIQFAGWIEDSEKWELLRSAWAVCYTSPKEGWGISSLEAQRVGTHAIVSDAPGLRDTVEDGVTGRLVPHGDVPALVEAMACAIERPEERAIMEMAAVEHASGYSWDHTSECTLQALERAAETPRAPRPEGESSTETP